jgi:hypothetical protein
LPGAKTSWHKRARRFGRTWSELDAGDAVAVAALTKRLTKLWGELLRAGHAAAACRMDADLPAWCLAAMELMAIADEAAAGIGFDNSSGLAQTARGWHWDGPLGASSASPEERRRRTATLCVLVPPEECCVQPKARTPQVGCNLRSLSLHLALLPPIGHVTTRHLISPAPLAHTKLNVLLVPYPYRIASDVFGESMAVPSEKWGRFTLRQSWLPESWPKRLAAFISELCGAAEAAGTPIHGVVLPELALASDGLDAFASKLVGSCKLDFLIAGALSTGKAGVRNIAKCFLFADGNVLTSWEQAKHHRWRLDEAQLKAYGLALRGRTVGVEWWWEGIDVANREVTFHMIHEDGGLLAAFICEDLARVDPVQPVVRAVGPNLLVALLMDGPQAIRRWPGRYANGLCEDPGTSVLTVSCAATVERWLDSRGLADAPLVAVWKDMWTGTDPRELALPRDHHALVLSLDLDQVEERTLDRRADEGQALAVKFCDVRPIRHPNPPNWVDRP